ncbi:TPA: hypothetical protein DIV55_03925 [Patescibacteria group bacterium]|nr:hypothetical protein [Patescibacteria group bacterium]
MTSLPFYQKPKSRKFHITPYSPLVERMWWFIAIWALLCATAVILLCLELLCFNFPYVSLFLLIFTLTLIINFTFYRKWLKRKKK